MWSNRVRVAGLLAFLLVSPAFSLGASELLGTEAPSFTVKSGDDKELTLKMLKGRVVSLIYETKDVVEKNRKLKEELRALLAKHNTPSEERAVGVSVIDCTAAFWPITRIWKSKLRENSKKEGITIYGDWDGKMFSDYKMVKDESNVVVIDRQGIVRYFNSGRVETKEIGKIKDLLETLISEEPPADSNVDDPQ